MTRTNPLTIRYYTGTLSDSGVLIEADDQGRCLTLPLVTIEDLMRLVDAVGPKADEQHAPLMFAGDRAYKFTVTYETVTGTPGCVKFTTHDGHAWVLPYGDRALLATELLAAMSQFMMSKLRHVYITRPDPDQYGPEGTAWSYQSGATLEYHGTAQ